METVKTVDKLTTDRANILTKTYENGEQVGLNHRCSYANSESGRVLLIANEPKDIVTEIMAVWGNSPTVEEPEIPEIEKKPTPEEEIAELKETVAAQDASIYELAEVQVDLLLEVSLMQLEVTE